MNESILVKDGMDLLKLKKLHVNGNVTIDIRQEVTERLNVKRIKLYRPPTSDP